MKTLFLLASLIDDNKTINYGTILDGTEPIQIYEKHTSHHCGIITDIIKYISTKYNIQVNYFVYPFNRLIYTLNKTNTLWITIGSSKWANKVQTKNLIKETLMDFNHILLTHKSNKLQFTQSKDSLLIKFNGFDYPMLNESSYKVIKTSNYISAFNLLSKYKNAFFIEVDVRILFRLKNYAKKEELKLLSMNKEGWSYPITYAVSGSLLQKYGNIIAKEITILKEKRTIKKLTEYYSNDHIDCSSVPFKQLFYSSN